MKTYCLVAHCHFEAESPEDAMRQLAEHFGWIADEFEGETDRPESRLQLASGSLIKLEPFCSREGRGVVH